MIRLIVAVDKLNGMARNGSIPWDVPSDRRYFARLTKTHGGIVLIGRKTYQTLHRPLQERTLYVASRTSKILDGAEVVRNAVGFLRSVPDCWVAGGEDIYRQTLGIADEIYLTRIDQDFDCDQFFPEFSNKFKLDMQKTEIHSGKKFCYEVWKLKQQIA